MSKILIDIGCFNAKTNSITYKLLKKKREKWFGFMIEPNPYMKEDILNNLEGTQFQYFNLAISNKNGISPFYLGKYGFFNRREKIQKKKCMRSSLVCDKDYVKQHLSDEQISIETKTLKQFIKDNNISHIDLLKIDTEGHDYDILKEYFVPCTSDIIYPQKIITEDIVKNKEEEYSEQNIIKAMKKKLLVNIGYQFRQLDFYNSEFILDNQKKS
jgi:FkbM family methyltransferase